MSYGVAARATGSYDVHGTPEATRDRGDRAT
jgi:hypothetical protein